MHAAPVARKRGDNPDVVLDEKVDEIFLTGLIQHREVASIYDGAFEAGSAASGDELPERTWRFGMAQCKGKGRGGRAVTALWDQAGTVSRCTKKKTKKQGSTGLYRRNY